MTLVLTANLVITVHLQCMVNCDNAMLMLAKTGLLNFHEPKTHYKILAAMSLLCKSQVKPLCYVINVITGPITRQPHPKAYAALLFILL